MFLLSIKILLSLVSSQLQIQKPTMHYFVSANQLATQLLRNYVYVLDLRKGCFLPISGSPSPARCSSCSDPPRPLFPTPPRLLIVPSCPAPPLVPLHTVPLRPPLVLSHRALFHPASSHPFPSLPNAGHPIPLRRSLQKRRRASRQKQDSRWNNTMKKTYFFFAGIIISMEKDTNVLEKEGWTQ